MRYILASSIISCYLNLRRGWRHMLGHWRAWAVVAALAVILPAAAAAGAYALIEPNKNYIVSSATDSSIKAKGIQVGIVFGSGITYDGRPYPELQSRLDTAAAALQRGDIQKLLLSGDNRFDSYDEPGAMINYLETVKHISAAHLQPDYAGRSTYESCERAAKVFGLHQAVLFSADSHLPRAIYLCRQFGIDAYGVPSSVEASNAQRREAMARVKAVLNVYGKGENTILGPAIAL